MEKFKNFVKKGSNFLFLPFVIVAFISYFIEKPFKAQNLISKENILFPYSLAQLSFGDKTTLIKLLPSPILIGSFILLICLVIILFLPKIKSETKLSLYMVFSIVLVVLYNWASSFIRVEKYGLINKDSLHLILNEKNNLKLIKNYPFYIFESMLLITFLMATVFNFILIFNNSKIKKVKNKTSAII